VTIIVGVKCTDGVVIGADSAATSSIGPQRLIQIVSDDKINIVGGKVIIACTGAVGLSQRFHGVVKAAWDPAKLFQKPLAECLREIARNTLKDFDHTGVQRLPANQGGLQFGSLLAAPIEGAAQLIEFGSLDFQPEIKKDQLHFVSMGSGQVLADPFLAFVSRVLWGAKPPNVQMGAFGVYWVLSHTIQYAPGGVGRPIKVAVLKKERGEWVARSVEGDELQEPEQHVAEIEKLIASYPKVSIESTQASLPPPPPAQEEPSR
jgi:hypothetical protein